MLENLCVSPGVIMKLTDYLLVALWRLNAPALASDRVENNGGKWVQTPYQEQNVLFDFYFDEPDKINLTLYWIRAQINPLMDEPCNQAPEFMNTVVVIYGTEIVTVAHKNYQRYRDAVERMRCYADLGVRFMVCGLAAENYDYSVNDFNELIEVVPSAITELAHWQQPGYSLITPTVLDKKHAIEDIR